MDKAAIEIAVRRLQKKIWEERAKFCPVELHKNPVYLLEPEYAASVLGVKFTRHEELVTDPLTSRGSKIEIAGLIDRQRKEIAISRKFPARTIRFTSAHEIGHWVLHREQVMFRDMPIQGLQRESGTRDHQEAEADYFAACFLMPRKLVIERFEANFLTEVPLVIDDTTAFYLCPSDPDSILRAESASLTCALAAASCESYGGQRIPSMAKQFRVSVTSMAIRIKELGLIQE
ncbi:MAG: ImmA/IrrE family metallo-endopeptidase [Gammaproteobacteria bacterium]